MCNVFYVAKQICEKSEWSVTNLQLQKILYIAQVLHIGLFDKTLFKAKFQAWDYGPVIPILYHKLKMFGNKPLESWAFLGIDEDCKTVDKNFISEIAEKTLSLPTSKLVGLTHRQGTGWQKRYGSADNEISEEDMKNEFVNVWVKDAEKRK